MSGLHSEITVEGLLQEFEATFGSRITADTRLLHQAQERLKADNDPRAEEVGFEILLFELTRITGGSQRFVSTRRGITETGETYTYPDPDRDFSQEALDYYLRRIGETTNEAQRAVYCDFIWFKKEWKLPNKINILRQAVESYLEASRRLLTDGFPARAAEMTVRALDLALAVGQESLITAAVGEAVRLFCELERTQAYRWTFEILEFLAENYRKVVEHIEATLIPDVVERTLAFYRAEERGYWHFHRRLLEVLASFYSASGQAEQSLATRERRAETYVEEAAWKRTNFPNGNLVAAGIYQKALRAYIDLGRFPEKVRELKAKVRESNRDGFNEFDEVEYRVEFTQEQVSEFQRYVESFQDMGFERVLNLLAVARNFWPSLEEAKQSAPNEISVFEQISPIELHKGDLVSATLNTMAEKLDYYTGQHLLRSLDMRFGTFVSPILDDLVDAYDDLDERITSFIGRNPIITEVRLHLIKSALSCYTRGDYIATIHVLAFQIEGALRDLLSAAGEQTYTYRDGRMREMDLGDVLKALGKLGRIDEDFLEIARYLLADMIGRNIRNEVGHGIAGLVVFTKTNAELLIVLMMRLSLYRPLPVTDVEQEAEVARTTEERESAEGATTLIDSPSEN